MMPSRNITLVDCDGDTLDLCAYVATVTMDVSDDGTSRMAKLVAHVNSLVDFDVQTLVMDGVSYSVLAVKQMLSTCTTKLEAFRAILMGCEVCDGFIRHSVIAESCEDDSGDLEGNSTPVRFSARHLETETRVLGDIVTHIETHELTFETRPELTSDNIIEGCDKLFKVRQVINQGDIRRPMQVIAEVTPRPRARV